MASTYTTSGRLNKQATGDNLNLWGSYLNSGVFDLVDTMIAGVTTITVTGDVTLTSLNGQADQARAAQIVLNGAPTANFTVYAPGVPKLYRVFNNTGKIATFAVAGSGGDTTTVDGGDIIDVETDGVDFSTPGVGGVGWKAYISSVVAGGPYGNVPSVIGQNGKFLTNNGTIPLWDVISATQLSDYNTKVVGVQVALAVSL